MYLALPGFLFAVNNLLLYPSIWGNEMASFGVFRDTTVLFNAAIWCVVFKTTLGVPRSCALVGIFIGLFLNQITPLLNSTFTHQVLLVLLFAASQSCSAVSHEYAIKQNSALDLNLQNGVFNIFTMTTLCMYIALKHPTRFSGIDAFFQNFDLLAGAIIGLQLCWGLVISRILKYADAVMMFAAACLRGPLLLFLAPAIGLYSRLDHLTIISSVVVSSSSFYFVVQGKLTPGSESQIKLDDKTNDK
eukprot:gnl/MRDRNA2_/MRDRNA2_16353_c0_seq1.p1 gnl/MRDRNA2_/MRDRNA2_16353_c0~~gnl/MRDRNA2_/MRDRNA2_16353_c0_seq1.p1  ORF type:complete len:246 (-),score=21.26 gnl/MRDRNA2_/MRDRNA2_16353_c0_seq1:84-821(-)